jgi:RsmE family RNA methyltransferase
MNLIIVRPEELSRGNLANLGDGRARHILTVLAAGAGSTVRVGLLDGPLGTATVERVEGGHVVLACTFDPRSPEPPRLDLLLALPRPKVLGRLWSQLAALGVGRIVVVNAARVERCYFDSHVLAPGYFTPRLIEGLQQARDTRLPEVLVRRRLRPFVEDELDALFPGRLRLLADPTGERRIGDLVPAAAGGAPPRVLLAVGPEGGWVPFELELLRARGFELVGMGPRTLRSDTACIALLGIVAEHIGAKAAGLRAAPVGR